MTGRPIRCSDHLEDRLILRHIGGDFPEHIIREPQRSFTGTATGYRIAVATVAYRGADHLTMVASEEIASGIVAAGLGLQGSQTQVAVGLKRVHASASASARACRSVVVGPFPAAITASACPPRHRLLCAVVKRLDGEGFLITAYPCDKIKEGDQVWPTSESSTIRSEKP